ncbi:hypothetical protein [Bacillus thuringiensis]|uniref:hypothetical protein n=1 Tax=Bacillus thuringiensis TaxID=1428 RepID=UPI000BFC3B17|nr:hypothetical protein [Bacillus thuringiensis]PGT90111.1 hypothetical protein COD17_10195 [Bacillus thuringiensis]
MDRQEKSVKFIANMLNLHGKVLLVSENGLGSMKCVERLQTLLSPKNKHALFGREEEIDEAGVSKTDMYSRFLWFPYTHPLNRDYWTMLGLATSFHYISMCEPKISLRRDLWKVWTEKQLGGFVTMTKPSVKEAIKVVQNDLAVLGRGDLRNLAVLFDLIVAVREDGTIHDLYRLEYRQGELMTVWQDIEKGKVS